MKKGIVLLAIAAFTIIGLKAQVNLQDTFEERRHGVITSAISFDGEKLATAGDDNEIIVWHLQSKSIYRRLTGLDQITKSLAFSSDGRFLVSGGKDSKVYIWDIDKATIRFSLIGHSGDVNAVAFSHDNSIVASGGGDRTIRIWDAKTANLLQTLSNHSRDIASIDFSPTGNRMASSSADGTIIIWNTSNWAQDKSIDAHRRWARSVVFSPDGKKIASCGDDRTVKIFDINGNLKHTLSGHRDWVQRVSFSPDGRYLASGSHDRTFIIWDAENGTEIYKSPTQTDIVYSINFSPTGKTLVASYLKSREVNIWDASSLNIQSNVVKVEIPAEKQQIAEEIKPKQTAEPAQAQTITFEQVAIEQASLEIGSINFWDANSNGIIDAGEQASFEVTIKNTGKGTAHNAKLFIVEQNGVRGLDFKPIHDLGNIGPNSEHKYRIPIVAAQHLETSNTNFRISLTESSGSSSKPLEMAIATKKLVVPMVVLHEYVFTPVNSDVILRGSKFKLSMIVQNQGDATARVIKVTFDLPENALIVSDTEFIIAELTPQEYKMLEIELMTTSRYIRPNVPVEIFVTESTGLYGDRKIASARFNEGNQGDVSSPLLALSPPITASPQPAITPAPSKVISEIDMDIPKVGRPDPNRYALIIGNEDYSSFQRGLRSESDVEFAIRDAESFKLYALNVLKVPDDNIIFRTNATATEMHRAINQINTITRIKEGKAEIFVMYAGHGFPDEKTQEPYLVPVDVSGADLQLAIKLSDFYAKLTEHPTKRVTVFLDACFSGGGREQGLVAARGVRVRPRENVLSGNLVVFAATTGDQSALPWREKEHGMFTYHLLNKLKETKGNISYGELADYLRVNVGTRSVMINQKEQNPQTNVSNDVVDKWATWKF